MTTDGDAGDRQALPGDGLREGIVDELRRRIGEALVDTDLQPERRPVGARRHRRLEGRPARPCDAMGFEYFCFLSAIDWMPSPYGRGEDDPTEPPPERSTEIRQGVTGGETRFQVLRPGHRHPAATSASRSRPTSPTTR